MNVDIIAVGGSTIDHVSIVTQREDGWEVCQPPLVQGGGLMATAAVAVARLGASVELWAVAGDDRHGQMMRQELASYGVVADQVRTVAGIRTPCSYIEVDAETGDRTIYLSLGRVQPLREADLAFDYSRVDGIKCLLVDAMLLPASLRAAQAARRAGVTVVADLSQLGGPNGELVPLVDALIVPEETGAAVAGESDFPLALARMAAMGPRLPVVTVGPRGAWYWVEGRVYHCPAFAVRAVDTTGCGDSFHGAFAYAAARGWDVHTSIRFASAVAALKATKLGGRTGLPTLEAVESFLAERPEEGLAKRI